MQDSLNYIRGWYCQVRDIVVIKLVFIVKMRFGPEGYLLHCKVLNKIRRAHDIWLYVCYTPFEEEGVYRRLFIRSHCVGLSVGQPEAIVCPVYFLQTTWWNSIKLYMKLLYQEDIYAYPKGLQLHFYGPFT